MSDAKAFGPYLPNDSMRDLCLNTAETLWQNKQAMEAGQLAVNSMAYASGFHALCGYCDGNTDCPKFHDAEYQPEWQTDLQRLADLKESRKALDAEIDEMEAGLWDYYSTVGLASVPRSAPTFCSFAWEKIVMIRNFGAVFGEIRWACALRGALLVTDPAQSVFSGGHCRNV